MNCISIFNLQLTIRAYDGDVPEPRSDYGELTITVDSNLQTPVIITPGVGANYQARLRILETTDFNTVVYRVVASDSDASVSISIYLYICMFVYLYDI